MDNIADCNADSPTRSAFLLDHFGATALGALENSVLKARRAFRQPSQRQAIDRGARPNRQHGVTMFTEDKRLHLHGSELELIRDEGAETRCIKHCAQPISLL